MALQVIQKQSSKGRQAETNPIIRMSADGFVLFSKGLVDELNFRYKKVEFATDPERKENLFVRNAIKPSKRAYGMTKLPSGTKTLVNKPLSNTIRKFFNVNNNQPITFVLVKGEKNGDWHTLKLAPLG